MLAQLITSLPPAVRKKWISENLSDARDQLNRVFRCLALSAAHYADSEENRMPEAYDSLKYLDELIVDLDCLVADENGKKSAST